MSALKEKRRTLAGQIELTQKALRELVHQLDAVDAALRVFDPSIDLEVLRDRPVAIQSQSFRGEMVRLILDALREKGEPMGVAAITERVMIGRGLPLTDPVFVRTMRLRVSNSLRQLRKRRIIASAPTLSRKDMLWIVAPNAPAPINENVSAPS
jgi:hypothetical protein